MTTKAPQKAKAAKAAAAPVTVAVKQPETAAAAAAANEELVKKVATQKPDTDAPNKPAAGSPGDPTDHSIGGGRAAAAEAAAEAPIDPLIKKIRASELYAVNDHPNGGGWKVAISPQNDPKASDASKRLSSVQPLDTFSPVTGLRVVPKDGEEFVVGPGFGPEATPADWQRVTKPDGSLLFP